MFLLLQKMCKYFKAKSYHDLGAKVVPYQVYVVPATSLREKYKLKIDFAINNY